MLCPLEHDCVSDLVESLVVGFLADVEVVYGELECEFWVRFLDRWSRHLAAKVRDFVVNDRSTTSIRVLAVQESREHMSTA